MIFYLGTHKPHWLELAGFPLMVSHRVLEGRRRLPRALAPWALDSGGFSELSLFHEWRTSPWDYARAVLRYHGEIGQLAWVAPQDWMCEPFMIERTGLSVEDHQARTVESVLYLRTLLAPTVLVIPVLQGYTIEDYQRCDQLYQDAGFDLAAEPVVGLGSVCRRQSSTEILAIVEAFSRYRLHGFGVKTGGLALYGGLLGSSDSMAWSIDARRAAPLTGCPHASCSNCLRYATIWRSRLVGRTQVHQRGLGF